MNEDFLKEFLDLQKAYFDQRFDQLEKKIDDHIGAGKQRGIRIIYNVIAPLCTGIICFLIAKFFK